MKPTIKRLSVLILMVIVSLRLIGCTTTDKQNMKSIVLDVDKSQEVANIKSMTLTGTDYSIGELIDSALKSSTYELYNPAEDGNRYVTITGSLTYMNKPVLAVLQYKYIGHDEYEFYALEFNDIPQDKLTVSIFFDFLVENYTKNKGLDSNKENKNTNVSKDSSINSSINKSYDTILYTNDRYGYSINYPKEWGIAEESEKGDGCILYIDDAEDIRVYASPLMETDFQSYLENYYEGWEQQKAYVTGANKAFKLIYQGEESYQTALVAEKNGIVYTFEVVDIYIDPEYSIDNREKINDWIEEAESTFKVF